MTKEQTIEAIRIMQAYVDEKEVECKYSYGWVRIDHPTWDWFKYQYRIKPTKTLRPWTKDEVPLGAWIKSKDANWKAVIAGFSDDGDIGTIGGDFSCDIAFKHCEHSLDGGKTWLPCGVEEESK